MDEGQENRPITSSQATMDQERLPTATDNLRALTPMQRREMMDATKPAKWEVKAAARKAALKAVSGKTPAHRAAQAQARFKKEQAQNGRWLRAQMSKVTDISPDVHKELKSYFARRTLERRDAAPPLSEGSQATLQRLHSERAARMAEQMTGKSATDWFKDEAKDITVDLAQLLATTSFAAETSQQVQATKRISKRMSRKLGKRRRATARKEREAEETLQQRQELSRPVIDGMEQMAICDGDGDQAESDMEHSSVGRL